MKVLNYLYILFSDGKDNELCLKRGDTLLIRFLYNVNDSLGSRVD